MKIANYPSPFNFAWAQNGSKTDIPDETSDTTNGKANLAIGFPDTTMKSILNGGVPPWGQDHNGILNRITFALQWKETGEASFFNQEFCDAIGGYPQGAILQNNIPDGSNNYTFWLSLKDDNIFDPNKNDKTNASPQNDWVRFPVLNTETANSLYFDTEGKLANKQILPTVSKDPACNYYLEADNNTLIVKEDGTKDIKANIVTTKGNLYVGGELDVDGTASFGGNVECQSQLHAQSNLLVSKTSAFTENATFSGGATVNGQGGDAFNANVDCNFNQNVYIAKTAEVKSTLTVEGDINTQGALNVGKNVTLAAVLGINSTDDHAISCMGGAFFDKNVNAKDFIKVTSLKNSLGEYSLQFSQKSENGDFIDTISNTQTKKSQEYLKYSYDDDKNNYSLDSQVKFNQLGGDLAEYYHSDRTDYKKGQVMMIGGEKEITLCTNASQAFGVYSSDPCTIMNNKNKTDEHIEIALLGRVPVFIEGKIKKGQFITATDHGTAVVSTNKDDIILGRSLQDKNNSELELIECFVKIG